MPKLLLSLLAATVLLRADFEPQHWQYRRTIHLPSSSPLCRLTLDSSVYAYSRAQLNDLRVIRDTVEVPYELQVSADKREERNLPLHILNKAVVPGRGLQATLDLNGHPQHNRLRIATTQRNFKETMRVETSDDSRRWSLVRNEALLFDISRQDRSVKDLTVEYPVSTRRYVRLTIPGWNDPAFLTSAWLLQLSENKAIRDQAASLSPAVTQDPTTHSTAYTFDIGFHGQPYDELELSVEPDLFFRNADVYTSNTENDWIIASSTVISNRPDDPHLRFPIPEQWNRYVKVVVGNGDSPPITIKRLKLFALRRSLRFATVSGGHYWLYSGNAAAQAPHYDLTQILTSNVTPVPFALAPPGNNPTYETPALPWSDRNPYLLTGLVIAAAALMVFVTVRLLVRVNTA